MDTLSHGAWAYLTVHNHAKRRFFIAGAVFPDAALILTAIVLLISGHIHIKFSSPLLPQLWSLSLPPNIDSVMHSIFLWTGAYVLAMVLSLNSLWWFINGIYLHLGIDLLTHKDFSPQYLWPLHNSKVSGLIDYRSLGFTVVNILLLSGFVFLLIYYKRIRARKFKD